MDYNKKLGMEEVKKKSSEIIKWYVHDNKSINDIAKMINTYSNYIRKILVFNNVDIRTGKTGYRENPKIILEKYISGQSSESIAKELNIGATTVLRILRENNILIRSQHEIKLKYSLDEDYFEKIDTPNKAYILGLMYADGCNHIKRNFIKIELKYNDKELLEKVRKEMKIEKPLKYNNKQKERERTGKQSQDTYSIDIYSKKMCKDLEKMGCVERKSLVLKWPDWLENSLLPHFIRGYFDGDGSIKSKKGCEISFASCSWDFINGLQEILEKFFNVETHVYRKQDNHELPQTLVITKQSMSKVVLDWVYKDADIYMERKYIKYYNKFYKNT